MRKVKRFYCHVFYSKFRILFFPGQSAKVLGYGHLGDGNLHLNISTPEYDDTVISSSFLIWKSHRVMIFFHPFGIFTINVAGVCTN